VAKSLQAALCDRLVVIGLGLIGGSFALGVREQGLAREVVGFDLHGESRELAVQLGVADRCEAELAAACAGADVIMHEATYNAEIGEGRGKQWRHSDAARVARFAQAAQIPNLVLMHFSARFGDDPSRRPHVGELQQEAQALYGGRLFMAQDFARYHLQTDGVLVSA